MRVCCLIFADIQNHRGERLLRLDPRWTAVGRYFAPVGGVVRADYYGMSYLTSRLGADNFEFEQDRTGKRKNELRFSVPEHNLSGVVDWFGRRTQRDKSALPHAQRELAPLLASEDVTGEQWLRHTWYKGATASEVPTIYLVDVYKVILSSRGMARLEAAVNGLNVPFLFVPAEGICRGNFRAQRIRPISQTLLDENEKK